MMGKGTGRNSKAIWMLKSLLTSYILTAVSLLILALLLYRLDLNEQKVTMGIIVIYVLSTFAGGFLMGKLVGERKFLWGFMLGTMYFLVLFGISLAVDQDLNRNGMNLVTTMVLCAGGGMLGGMVS